MSYTTFFLPRRMCRVNIDFGDDWRQRMTTTVSVTRTFGGFDLVTDATTGADIAIAFKNFFGCYVGCVIEENGVV